MAEEKVEVKEEEQASSEQVETTEAQVQEQAQEKEVDYKARYQELEAEHTKVTQKAKEDAEMLEAVTPHVNWNAVHGGGQEAEASGEYAAGEEGEGAEDYISKKAHEESLRQVQSQTDVKLLTMQFRTEHPELRPYESTLIVPEVVRLRRTNPRLSADQLIAKAAEFADNFLKTERAKGGEKAKAEVETKVRETAKAGGFGSAGTTTPKKPESQGGESAEENVARRVEQSRKARGLISS